MIGKDANALASSIVLVCRRRNPDAETIGRTDFLRALKRELPAAIDNIRKAGVGPVDMQQSVIGPAMGIFTRYASVQVEEDDSTMPVKTALALINRVWGEIESELDLDFDAETQVALAWYDAYGFDERPSGDLIVLATAKNIPQKSLFDGGVFVDLRGKTALARRDQLPTDWRPSTDKTLTVWECVQHTARTLRDADGGHEAAARLVAEMGPAGDKARKLAYRLFEIATTRKRSDEALVYNELAQDWSRLETLADTREVREAVRAPVQGRLDI
jgi:putative DNA methylase